MNAYFFSDFNTSEQEHIHLKAKSNKIIIILENNIILIYKGQY